MFSPQALARGMIAAEKARLLGREERSRFPATGWSSGKSSPWGRAKRERRTVGWPVASRAKETAPEQLESPRPLRTLAVGY